MIQVIVLLSTLINVFNGRIARLRQLTCDHFPEVSSGVFMEWKSLRESEWYWLNWAGWKLFLLLLLGSLSTFLIPTEDTRAMLGFAIQVLGFALFITFIVMSGISGGKAKKLEREYGLKIPKKNQKPPLT